LFLISTLRKELRYGPFGEYLVFNSVSFILAIPHNPCS
jgi:hypothetical protein